MSEHDIPKIYHSTTKTFINYNKEKDEFIRTHIGHINIIDILHTIEQRVMFIRKDKHE